MEGTITAFRWRTRPAPASAAAAARNVGAQALERAERDDQVDVEHGLELLVGHAVDAAVPGVAGVVHHHVEGTEGAERVGDEGVAGVGDHQVDDQRRGGTRSEGVIEGPDGLLGLGPVDLGDHDVGAVGSQGGGRGAADASGTAGDDRDLPAQQVRVQGSSVDSTGPTNLICSLQASGSSRP
jgi:hypothetical protein